MDSDEVFDLLGRILHVKPHFWLYRFFPALRRLPVGFEYLPCLFRQCFQGIPFKQAVQAVVHLLRAGHRVFAEVAGDFFVHDVICGLLFVGGLAAIPIVLPLLRPIF